MYISYPKTTKWIHCTVVFLLFIPFFVTFSAFGVTAKEFAKEKVLTVALSRAPITLDARYATDAGSIRLLNILSSGLVKLDENFKYQPSIAGSYSQQNFQKYIFTLKNINFSDGEKLTSQHIKSFYESIMQKGSGSPLLSALSDIKKIETPELNIIEFHLKKPNPWFLTVLETPIFKIPQPATQRIENPIGLNIGQNISFFKKTDIGDVWIKENNRTIKLQVIKDPTVRILKLLKGEIDVIYNDLPDELYSYAKQKGYKNIRKQSASYSYIGFNLESGATSNSEIRRALSYAINRQHIMKHLLNNEAVLANSLLLDTHPAIYKAKTNQYNPQKAIEILENAGYKADKNGVRLNMDMSVTTNPFVLRIAQIIQQQLKDIGINLNISSSEWGSFYGNIKKGNFESYILTWVGRFQPDIFYSLFHSSMKPPHGANRGRYDNIKMDKLLETIQNSTIKEDIYKSTIQVQKLQEKEQIYLPLWRRNHGVVMGKNITGCTIFADGGYAGLLQCLKK